MNLLILGGGKFVGRHLAEAAVLHGHSVTLFNRGQSNRQNSPYMRHITGDRTGDLSMLAAGRWDAVIDSCGYYPRDVRRSAQALSDSAKQYLFISSASVYTLPQSGVIDESSELAELTGPQDGPLTEKNYGALKVLCERAVLQQFAGRTLIVRPGFIVGPGDHTGRFVYWVRRIAEGGEILAPDPRDHPFQIVDARDLADWSIRSLESANEGFFNIAGPGEPLTWQGLLSGIRDQLAPDAQITWAAEAWLREQSVAQDDFPMWFPSEPDRRSLMSISSAKAISRDLAFRPLWQTILDTSAWLEGDTNYSHVGLSRKRESELLHRLCRKQPQS